MYNLGEKMLSQLKELREQKKEQLIREIKDVDSIIENLVLATEGKMFDKNSKVYAEIKGIADEILLLKEAIAEKRPDEHFQPAALELDAVAKTTEEAANTIMDACEEIQGLVSSTGSEIDKKIAECTARIFEACNFQDMTGQRITKVMRALADIEKRVKDLIEIFNIGVGSPVSKKTSREKTQTQPEAASEDQTDKHLRNGPQLPDAAPSQDDIDALFNSIKDVNSGT